MKSPPILLFLLAIVLSVSILLGGNTEKPIIVMFSAKWCGPCATAKKDMWGDLEKDKRIKTVIIDVDKQPETAKKYLGENFEIPTFIIYNPTEDFRIVGYDENIKQTILERLKMCIK